MARTKSKPPVQKPLPPLDPAAPLTQGMALKRFLSVPAVGTTVQYTVTDGQTPGAIRAAIITAVFHEPGWQTDMTKVCWEVNLTIFPNQSGLSLHEETHPPCVPYNDDPSERRSWRFITDGIYEDAPEELTEEEKAAHAAIHTEQSKAPEQVAP